MRVISGYLKGRNIDGYDTIGTRPTMNRVKESMFASIQEYINDSLVLDLFSGSGSLGIEAISMGAKKCYFVDNGREILNILRKNINNLNIEEKSTIINRDYREALLYFKNNNIKFNIILVDAPYKMEAMNEVIELVNKYNLLEDNGVLVLEYSINIQNKESKTKAIDILKYNYSNLRLIKSKKYGDKYVNIYLKEPINY